MSDVIYNISSGFFDSVNGDRLYSAADMNKPYKRVIADGIFPTPQGTPSTDFQVVAVSGMSVAVLAGNAMIGARWAESADDVGITIAGNSSSSPRIDSIFLHIDTGMETRAAGVVYRQGTAGASPTAPAIVKTDNITELRLADILVAPSAAIITQANITDQRGGSECPWVAGLIQQVDTSALFDQYRAAYAEQQQDQADEWKTFMDHLARDYDISMSLRKHESTYTSTAAASLIPINIDGYDTTKDLLQVFINGIFAVEGTHYIVKSAAQIQLTNAISAGQKVHFVIYKAVMGGAQPIIPTDEQVQDAVDNYMDAHPGALVVDPELSDTSTHAIQNKAVTEAVTNINGRLAQLDSTVNGETSQNFVEGKNIATDGSLVDATDICVSDFVPITWTGYGTYYCNDNTTTSYVVAFYDDSKTFLKKFQNPSATGGVVYRAINHDTQASGAAFVRFSFASGTIGKIMDAARTETLWQAEVTTDDGLVSDIGNLSDLVTENKDNLVGAINELNAKIPEIPDVITPEDTSFFTSGVNLVNPDNYADGYYVNQNTGAFVANSAHRCTGYVEVNPEKSYCITFSNNTARETRYAFYDANKTFLSGNIIASASELSCVESPENAKYIAVSIGTQLYDIMVAESESVIPFEPYALYVDPQYINMGNKAKLNLPSKIYAVVGFELNIYFENITEEWAKYDWDITCSVGKQMERGYQITPVAENVGTKTLTVTATDEYGNESTVIASLIITAATAGSGLSKSVIILGDSTTNNGIAVTKLNENFADDVMSVTTLGTRGTAPNNHEGRSGWTLDYYFTKEYIDYTDGRGHVANPFYNPSTQTFDAAYYFANSGIAVPDFFVLNMGINDVFSYNTDTALDSGIDQFVSYVDAAIASIKAAAPNTKICVCCTIPPNHSQDAFGKAYSCNQTRNRYKRNNTMLVDRIIEEYDGRESENIYVIPIHTNLDTVYNMGMETLPVNARNTDITYQSPISNGGVHPVESGYWQIADVYTAFLKANA